MGRYKITPTSDVNKQKQYNKFHEKGVSNTNKTTSVTWTHYTSSLCWDKKKVMYSHAIHSQSDDSSTVVLTTHQNFAIHYQQQELCM